MFFNYCTIKIEFLSTVTTRSFCVNLASLALCLSSLLGGTGISGLMRGLVTIAPRWIQEPSVVRDMDGRPPRGPPGSALLLCVAGVHCWEISLGKQIQGT